MKNHGMTLSEGIFLVVFAYILFTQGLMASIKWLAMVAIIVIVPLCLFFLILYISEEFFLDSFWAALFACVCIPFFGLAMIGEKIQNKIWGEYTECDDEPPAE